MSKSRKLTTSRSELLLGIYSDKALVAGDSQELCEDEVWSAFGCADKPPGNNSQVCATPEERKKNKTAAHRRIIGPCGPHHVAASAPVDVPDWSKIYRVDSVESLHGLDGYEDPENEVVPPHEYLAREHRRIATNSVFEGVGRTLKGRDMRRVRDSVWCQTGFDG